MDIESIRDICNKLPSVTEDVKWGNDLCFLIGEKMFCVISLNSPLAVSFKVREEEFDEMTALRGITPAPYVARYKWILVTNTGIFNKKKWEHYITQSYHLVKANLSKKKLARLK